MTSRTHYPKLSAQEVVFVSALTAIVIDPTPDEAELALSIRDALDAMPQCSRKHPALAPVLETAELLLIRSKEQPTLRERRQMWSSGHWRVRAALRYFYRWRVVETREVLKEVAEQERGR